jgi:hypothetical protein
MSATCLYIFKKGAKVGQYCPTHPQFGQYCAKHKQNKDYNDDNEKDESSLIKKAPIKKLLCLQRFDSTRKINPGTNIVFENNKPVGKAMGRYEDKFYPLLETDILTLKNLGIEQDQYIINITEFKKMFYPKKLYSFCYDNLHRCIKHTNYPFVVDTENNFAYKYDEESNTFDFYGTVNQQGDISQDINPYILKLLQIINLYGLQPEVDMEIPRPPRSEIPREEVKEEKEEVKEEVKEVQQQFTLSFEVQCTFYNLGEDTCTICDERKQLYYSDICEKPHPCCKKCWKRNKQITCPFCRKTLYT